MLKSSLAQRHQHLFEGLCGIIAGFVARAPFLALLYYRVRRTMFRLDRLVLRWQEGTLKPPRPSRPRASAVRAPRPRLPTSFGWLLRHAQPTAQYTQKLEMLLNDPEIVALLQAAPQAGRLLRPLAHMLLIKLPAHLRLPEKPEKPRPAPKPRLPRVRPGDYPSSAPPHLRHKIPGRKFGFA